MTYRIEFTDAARKSVAHLAPSAKRQIKESLRFLSQNAHGGEPLRRELTGLWKFRVGRFRLIYRLESYRRVVVVVAVGHRKDIYERL